MTARWDIAAVVVALLAIFAQVISVSPAALSVFNRIIRKLLCLAWPKGGQCRRLTWNDIPPGLLHQCNPPALCPHHIPRHSRPKHSPNCWDETLGQVFTEAWKHLQPTPKDMKFLSQKPYSLPLTQEYIQIDIKTLKAYLMLTTKLCHTCETDDMMALLGVKMCDGIITIHLKNSPRASIPRNHALSKFEVDQFIEGYPPFYRESFETTGGIKLGPSIMNSDGIGRGSWILAVGMSTSMGKPCGVHNMQRITEKSEDKFWKGTLVPTAFNMIRRTLLAIQVYEAKHGEFRIPGKGLDIEKDLKYWSTRAIRCCDTIMTDEYSALPWPLKEQQIEASDLFEGVVGSCPCKHSCIGNNTHADSCGRNLHSRKEPAKALNKKECEAALEIFDNYRLSDDNLAIILPKLPQILQTLILGMSEVEHYFSYLSRKLELPREIADQKYVYLRKFVGDID